VQDAKRWLEKVGFYVHDIRLEAEQNVLGEQVQRSLADKPAARQARLAKATQTPSSHLVLTRRFRRNPDVVAERLYKAQGVCEACHQPAPFLKKKDDEPFLEVHHVIPLADNGEDSVENTRAVCPNCHRKAHDRMTG
jgi:5-methylcytosine-specific restriction protein A